MQSTAARALVALVAVVVIVVGFIVLGEDEAGDESSVNPSTTATTTDEESASKPDPAGKPEPDEPAVPEVVVTGGGEPEGGVADLVFAKGDTIRFAVTSDVAEEVHVHGYDVEQEIEAGGKTEFEFPADIEGIFEVELHGTGTLIAELTVNP